jgi:profilin
MVIAGGITLHGFKFMAVRAEPEEVIGRKGEKGCFIVPTQQAILVAEVSISSPA